MKSIFSVALLMALLASCGLKEENEQLKAENQRLSKQLDQAEELSNTLDEVDVLLDSIEDARGDLTMNLEQGTSYDDYTDRIRSINEYIDNTKNRIGELEEKLNQSGLDSDRIKRQLINKRKELKEKEARIAELSNMVEKYRQENQALIKTVDLQKRELLDREEEIRKKRKEVVELENTLENLVAEAKQAEADAYFMRGKAKEEAAENVNFAPRKKKRGYKEAYDLYKKAFEAGRKDALAKMEALEEKID